MSSVSKKVIFAAHTIDVVAYRRKLMKWGEENFRAFPWRTTSDPFHLLVAEIMLHRTRALQVVPVYNSFIQRYPTPAAVRRASEQDLMSIMDSLGLHSRVTRLKEIVEQLFELYDGRVPEEKNDLLGLPGVGPYIAGAIRCFAFGKPDILPDTNTLRVTSRIFGVERNRRRRGNRDIWELIGELADPSKPDEYYYAQLDLAASVCHAVAEPACASCPVRAFCSFGSSER